MIMLVAVVRPSFSLIGWASACLVPSALGGLALGGLGEGRSPLLDDRLPTVGLVAGAVLALHLLVFPEEVLYLFPIEVYPWVQVAASAFLLVAVVVLLVWLQSLERPEPPATSLAETLRRAGRIPAGGSGGGAGRRRQRRRPAQGLTLVQRVQVAVTHRTAVVWRAAALGVVTVAAAAVMLVLARGVFVEGWVALLVALVLHVETKVWRWRRESLTDGFAEPDPDAGRSRYDTWWGLSAAWVLLVTATTTAQAGGVRPQPWWFYLIVMGAALAAAVQPWPRARAASGRIFVAWLERNPQRVAEFTRLRASWPPDRLAELGELPALPHPPA